MPTPSPTPKTTMTVKTLAFALVRRFGRSAARKACIANKWTNVLREIDSSST